MTAGFLATAALHAAWRSAVDSRQLGRTDRWSCSDRERPLSAKVHLAQVWANEFSAGPQVLPAIPWMHHLLSTSFAPQLSLLQGRVNGEFFSSPPGRERAVSHMSLSRDPQTLKSIYTVGMTVRSLATAGSHCRATLSQVGV